MSKPNPVDGPIRLSPTFRHYAWGDSRFIPDLTGADNRDNRPFAELWLGAHPSSPSTVEAEGGQIGLDRLLVRQGKRILGARVFNEFGGLPYLLKVLSVDRPLSIQVHPNSQQARRGFARENALKIPVDSARRCYRDDRHKPELVVALSDFYALLGFRPREEIEAYWRQTPEVNGLAPDLNASADGLRGLCRVLMDPRPAVEAAVAALLKRLRREAEGRRFSPEDPAFWMLKADSEFSRGEPDRGLMLIPLLNLVHLRPGQGLSVAAGDVHAHLKGAALEIMANSDNVVRCGLTPKHVDVEEFLRIARFSGRRPAVVEARPQVGGGELYLTDAREFELRRMRLSRSAPAWTESGEKAVMLFVLEAKPGAALLAQKQRWDLTAGRAWLIPRGVAWTIEAARGARVFTASTPSPGRAVLEGEGDGGRGGNKASPRR